MSEQQATEVTECGADCGAGVQRIATRDAVLGEGLAIRRALPRPPRRMIGAWCFLDHFGPMHLDDGAGMRVGPHPHTGLQTFTWLLQGELLHRDSLGTVQPIRAGQVNLMTAGRGISHSEESPQPVQGQLHGAQLWIALPDAQRFNTPRFQHIAEPPRLQAGGWEITVLAGEYDQQRSAAELHTPLLGLDLHSSGAAEQFVDLRPDFEHGVLVLDGQIEVDGQLLAPGELLALDPGRAQLQFRSASAARVLLIGGTPFEERIHMWWNFVGRSHEELVRYTDDWNKGVGFGEVQGYDGARIPAPQTPWHR